MGKYDDLILTIPKEFHKWYGQSVPRGSFRGTTVMADAKVYMGFGTITDAQLMEVAHMHHAVDEYIVFAPADLENFFDSFDAEIDIWIGDDPERMELFTVTEPVIIRIPPMLYHCPINFRRIGKPVLFSALYLDGNWSKIIRSVNAEGQESFSYDGAGIRRCVKDRSKKCVYCGECFSKKMEELKASAKNGPPPQEELLMPYYDMAKLPRTGAFDKYVCPFRPEHHSDPIFKSPRAGFRGLAALKDSRLTYLYNIVRREGVAGEIHTHHAVEEYLFFTGADTSKFFDFDAEIELQLGEDPDHMETITITAPSVIRIPPGLWHGPITFKRVGAPINFMPFYPSGSYGRIVRELRPDGTAAFIHMGDGL